ncbi:MAG TPA: hypothetical protein DET40_19995 [Lentisphaeria bacterium]|nr:MAG: hypothetical protein A2X45_24205 [Lentisphaerae bacterium GWF2_50_93]HCE45833.1 hypothetical protein [Lentisphaeria bacterium]
MSLIVTIYVREGIVMASDSRIPGGMIKLGPNQTLPVGAGEPDANFNTFLTNKNVGISVYGAGDINSIPIGTYVDSFVNHEANPKSLDVEQAADEIIPFFQKFKSPANIQFHVAGYKKSNDVMEQQVWEISVAEGRKRLLNQASHHGAAWGGETDILDRIFNQLYDVDPDGNATEMADFRIPWSHMSFDNAIDFAACAISTTETIMKFQPRPKSVGGSTDILTIAANGAKWVKKKENLISKINKEGYFQGKPRKVVDVGHQSGK